MENKEKLPVVMQYDEAQTIPLAVHEMHMARNDRRLSKVCFALCIGWAASLIVTVVSFVWLWNQYDYVSEETTTTTTTTEYSGVYNLVDAEGNVISADLAPEDVIRIMEALNNGESETDEDEDTDTNQNTQ